MISAGKDSIAFRAARQHHAPGLDAPANQCRLSVAAPESNGDCAWKGVNSPACPHGRSARAAGDRKAQIILPVTVALDQYVAVHGNRGLASCAGDFPCGHQFHIARNADGPAGVVFINAKPDLF